MTTIKSCAAALFGILAGAGVIGSTFSGVAEAVVVTVAEVAMVTVGAAGSTASHAGGTGKDKLLTVTNPDLTVSRAGSGTGTVISDVGAIHCGVTCSDTYAPGTPITLTATPDGSSQFTGWLGPCTGTGACQFTINGSTAASATFASTLIGTPTLDIDGNSSYDALTDGLLIIRSLFGLSGAPLINGVVGPGATRTTPAQIGDYLADIRPVLDIDGNGQADALTDGLLITRHLFGLRGASLIAGAIGPGAIRATALDIETQIQSMILTVTPVGITGFTATRTTLTGGASTTLMPYFVNATSATIDQGVGAVASGTGYIVSPPVTTTYTLTAAGIGGPVTQAVTITVVPAASIAAFTGSAASVISGNGTQLSATFSGGTGSIDHGIGAVISGVPVSTGNLASATTYTLTVINAAGDSVTATTAVQVNYQVSFTAGPGGSLGGSTSQIVAPGGSATMVTAVPSGGYSFVNWTGSGFAATPSNPVTVSNVTQNMTVTANFTALSVVNFLAGANGTLSGTTSQAVAAGGDCSSVTPVPNPGHGFLNWTGTGGFVTTAANPLTVTNVHANMTITANFQHLPVIGSFNASAGTIGRGQTAVLNWSALSSFTSASIDNGVGAVAGTSGMAFGYPVVTTTYTLTLSNAVGSTSSALTITVVPPPTIESFTATPRDLAAGQPTTLSWSTTGATSLSIDNGVGDVTGLASKSWVPPAAPPWGTTTTYRLTAHSIYGNASAATTVTSGPPAALTYSTNPATYNLAVAIAPNIPSNTGGPIDGGYIVVPALPLGLTLNPGTGVITGTPTFTKPTSTYVVRGTNSTYGYAQVSLVITVNETPPFIAYSSGSYNFDLGVPVSLLPGNTGGPALTWGIVPTLPAGLSFDASNGRISGIPTAVAPAQTYTITASNSGGTGSTMLSIAVTQTPPHIGYSSGSYNFYLGVPITTLVPTNTGGPVAAWAISPALPPGLNFDALNGHITGTPVAIASAQGYTVSATNAGGTGTVSPIISVTVQPPIISVQPYGQILSPGVVPVFSVTASGTGTLDYQWFRNGTAIGGANTSTYTAPAVTAGDDGTVYTVTLSDAYGGSTASDPAVLSVFQDLTTWLTANPAIAAAIKWQFRPAGANVYLAPAEADKTTWANWSPSQRADLNQAYLDYVGWYSQGAPQVTMTPGGTELTDQPTNIHPSANTASSPTLEMVNRAYMWKLYVAHVAFSLMLEISHQLPWTVTDYPDATLKWIFDSATMGWDLNLGGFYMGTYDQAGRPALRTDNRPRTTFADPRWTYPWLKQAGIVGPTRLDTIGKTLDWMRQNMTHFFQSESIGSDLAIWQYNGYSPISKIVEGTIDSNYPSYGMRHWTAGCHGSTGFLSAALRVVNIPVQPIWACGHELVYFMSEDRYMDHADNPYNSNVRASSASSLLLLIDSTTWTSRFGNDVTINITDQPTCDAGIGYTPQHFPP